MAEQVFGQFKIPQSDLANQPLDPRKADLDAASEGRGGVQCLMTCDELYYVARANLGPMKPGAYTEFEQQVQAVANRLGIERPRMVIDIIFKEGAHAFVTEQPYPISRDEWDIICADAKTMTKKMPEVFVVDGNKFSAPI